MRLRRWLFDRGDNLAGGIYGTILVTSLVAAADASDTIWRSLGFVEVTVVVFWLAHVYAGALACESRQQRAALAQERGPDGPARVAAAAGRRRPIARS